jgi:acetolactate synthase regulatory subunit
MPILSQKLLSDISKVYDCQTIITARSTDTTTGDLVYLLVNTARAQQSKCLYLYCLNTEQQNIIEMYRHYIIKLGQLVKLECKLADIAQVEILKLSLLTKDIYIK